MGWYAERFFPWLLEQIEGPEVHELRARSVAPARGSVLEIGFGTGKTLPYYGAGVTQLTVVEPSAGMNRKTEKALQEAPFATEVVAQGGELLPFPDASFDEAVSTMTLCSVKDQVAVLRELRRVLKPGGRFRFLEHVVSTDPKIARRQRLFDPIQKRIGCGCQLSRDTARSIVTAGFKLETLERRLSKDMPGFDERMFPLILGTARP